MDKCYDSGEAINRGIGPHPETDVVRLVVSESCIDPSIPIQRLVTQRSSMRGLLSAKM